MPDEKAAPNVFADDQIQIETRPNEVCLAIESRKYRIRGLEKNMSLQALRVNVMATRDDLVHLDTFDLCKAKARNAFIKAAASELFIDELTIKKDIGRLLLELEKIQQDQIDAATRVAEQKVQLTQSEIKEATQLLKNPQLVEVIQNDFSTCGLVGENTNKLICYLAAVSRLLPEPLAVLIQSSSAAGKTTLMDATLSLIADEDFIRYSAMTGQSLYYMGNCNLKHKVLAVAEEEGVAQASYALKLLQSDGKLRIAATGKNNGTGRQQTESYEVEGPVVMFLTTTNEHPDPELQNRCFTLYVNESSVQTAAIHQRQRAAYTLNGHHISTLQKSIRKVHQNAQRLLKPYPVIIPWAEQLAFRSDQTRMRRDHAKYLSLIASVTLLHQLQRPRRTRTINGEDVEYIEATIPDVELANRLASEVMGQSLNSLLPQTRQLLVLIDDFVNQRSRTEKKPRSMIRVTQRELREAFGWGDFQLRRHLKRLVHLEFVLMHRTGHGNSREYELLYDGEGRSGEPFLLGLIDPNKIDTSPSKV